MACCCCCSQYQSCCPGGTGAHTPSVATVTDDGGGHGPAVGTQFVLSFSKALSTPDCCGWQFSITTCGAGATPQYTIYCNAGTWYCGCVEGVHPCGCGGTPPYAADSSSCTGGVVVINFSLPVDCSHCVPSPGVDYTYKIQVT